MKEALVLITGQPRFSASSVANLKRNVIDALTICGYHVNVVMSMWDTNSFDKFKITVGESVPDDLLKYAVDVLKPAKLHMEPSIDFFATRERNKIQVPLKESPSYESQYYMLDRGATVASEWMRHSGISPHVAIRTRADLLMMRPISSPAVISASSRFLIPNTQGFGWVGSTPPRPWKMKKPWMPDQFWMAPWGMLEKMCRFHSRWHRGLTCHGPQIENMLHAFARENQIGYEQFMMQIKIVKTVNNR